MTGAGQAARSGERTQFIAGQRQVLSVKGDRVFSPLPQIAFSASATRDSVGIYLHENLQQNCNFYSHSGDLRNGIRSRPAKVQKDGKELSHE